LFFFNLCGKVVFLLDHCPKEKDKPVFPVLLSFADGLLSATQSEVVVVLLVLTTMLLILAAVFEKNAVKLFDVVFGDRYGLETLENHVHRIGRSRRLPARRGLRMSLPSNRRAPFHFSIAEPFVRQNDTRSQGTNS
jgi:hypothetical protein